MQERYKIRLRELIERLNRLFEGDLSDGDRLFYVDGVIKGKLLESEILRRQAISNTKEQFASSPDLDGELLNAIMDALAAHQVMSTQALESVTVRMGIKEVLLGPGGLWESLRRSSVELGCV